MKLKVVLYIFGLIAIILTITPFIAVDYWWIRVFDYPHVQLTIVTFVALLTFFMRFDVKRINDYIFVGMLLAAFVVQLLKIYPYTPLAAFEVNDSTQNIKNREIKLYAANVLQKNKKTDLLIADYKAKDPDILLLVETNKFWMNAVTKTLSSDYKYRVEIPLDNTYGMILYSKLELVNPEKMFVVDDSIPSIHSKVVLRSGDTIQLYTIHPTPPVPSENPMSTDRDSEMMQVAALSRNSCYPVIVFGDFNDVAWSRTTSLFHSTGELLDMRKGRGFYNTFNAKSTFMRWPLDHIFVSEEFRVKRLKLGEDINSDHFPTFAHINFEPEGAEEQKPEPPSLIELVWAGNQANKVGI